MQSTDEGEEEAGDEEEDEEEDEEKDEEEEDDDEEFSPLGMPDPILDDDGDQMELRVGEQIANKKLDHLRYACLALRANEDGVLPYVKAMYYHETQTSDKVKRSMDEETWIWQADDVLMAMDRVVLDTITRIDGNITTLYEAGGHAKDLLDRYKQRAEYQPTMYVRALTTGQSTNYRPLTKDEARTVASQAIAYASCREKYEDDAYKIDHQWESSWEKTMSVKGHRFFLRTTKKKIDKTRQEQLRTFGRVLLEQCDQSTATHMPVMHYVGYAMKGSERLRQHDRDGKSSSWLLQCIKAIMKATGIDTYVGTYFVCLITTEECVRAAEIVVTRLARAYYYAGGLSVGVAGASTNSSRLAHLDEKTREAKWADGLTYITDKTDYEANQLREIGLCEALQQAGFWRKLESNKKRIQAIKDDFAEMARNLNSEDALAVAESGEDWKEMFPEEFAKIEQVRQYYKEKTESLQRLG